MTKFTAGQQELLEGIIKFRPDGSTFDIECVSGNVVGSVCGHIDGNVGGDVKGNVDGNVDGNVGGTVFGNVFGNVVGNVFGNVVGNVGGNVGGYVGGNIGGDVWGDITGSVGGSVDGDVKGDVVGSIWGDVDDEVEVTPDPVNKPDHYTPKDGEIECITYIESVLGTEKFIGYCQGNVTKYMHRHAYKGKPVEDLEKAQVYLGWMLKAIKGERVR